MDKIHKNFEGDIEKEQKLIVPEFVDLTLLDYGEEGLAKQISEAEDLSYIPKEILETADFDTTFKWPEKLPEGFIPEKIMEEGKNPGLGIYKLHEQGITGRGVTVAIIDFRISETHSEFKDNIISNKDYDLSEEDDLTEISMHGPSVASLLVGKNCGVAPEAKLFYACKSELDDAYMGQAKALYDMIEYNKTHDEKIRIVSVSKGDMGSEEIPGLKEWHEAKKEAHKSGIIVIDSNYFGNHSMNGGGAKEDKEDFDNYNEAIFQKSRYESILKEFSLMDEKSKKYKIYKNYIDNTTNNNQIIVPSDYRTMASRKGDKEYVYNAKGGLSWAIPYYAGVFALALQVNPDLTNERFLEIVKETAGKTKKGLKVINPEGIIKEVKKMVEEEK